MDNYTVPVPDDKFNLESIERIGRAIYLLGHLIHKADWKTGKLITNIPRIRQETGIPRRTIERWMRRLRRDGQISTRRITNGLMITINNYEPMARTRGKWLQSQKHPNDAPDTPKVADQVPPKVADRYAKSGGSDTPEMAVGSASSGGFNKFKFNIKDIENTIQNSKPSSTSSESGGADAPGGRNGQGDDGQDAWGRFVALADEKLAAMDEADRLELTQRALKEMAGQRKWAIFVRRNEQGELEPAHRPGSNVLRRVIGEIIERESGGKEQQPL